MKLLFSIDRGSTSPLDGKEFQLPVTEVVMLDAAVKKEADGGFEELVGNLPLLVVPSSKCTHVRNKSVE